MNRNVALPATRRQRAPNARTFLRQLGRHDEARAILEGILVGRHEQWVTAYEIATIYCLLGDKDNAFRWLSQAEREHAVGFTFVRVDPHLEVLRSDPRFDQLLRGTDKTIP